MDDSADAKRILAASPTGGLEETAKTTLDQVVEDSVWWPQASELLSVRSNMALNWPVWRLLAMHS